MSNLSVKARMIAMAVCAVVSLSAFFAIQFLSSRAVQSANDESRALQHNLAIVTEMRLANLDMLLAAMDSIIDKEEGQIQPERKEVIDGAVEYITANVPAVEALAGQVGQPELAEGFAENFASVAQAIQVDLATAIETKAGGEAFAKLDDVIDDSGEVVAEKLTALNTAGQESFDASVDRADAAVEFSFNATVVTFLVALAVLLPLLFLTTRSIISPLHRMVTSMRALVDGDHSVEITDTNRRDEIGEMAQALQVFKDNAIETERLREQQKQTEAQAAEKQRQERVELADSFENEVGEVIRLVGSAATQLDSTAQSMSSIADETTRQATSVASASEQASSNVQAVASAAEELSASIHEISQQVASSMTMAKGAVGEAEGASTKIQGLASSAEQIGDVISLIQDIAEQTNLLALNATIEAARAGDAGKGFAVVAEEVKHLADQTAKATEDIGGRIERIQSETRETTEAIQQIVATIRKMEETATAVSAAVEEQGSATQEISRNVQEAASGTQQVNGSIGSVTQAANESGNAAGQVVGAVHELTSQSQRLESQVAEFLTRVRAA